MGPRGKTHSFGAREANFNRKRNKQRKGHEGERKAIKQERPDPRKPYAIECKYVGEVQTFKALSGQWHILERFDTKKERNDKLGLYIKTKTHPYKYRIKDLQFDESGALQAGAV